MGGEPSEYFPLLRVGGKIAVVCPEPFQGGLIVFHGVA